MIRILLALFGIITFTVVQAADGVLEINQTCAQGDGCFPGDDPGFPVRITSSGSFVLTSSLSVPSSPEVLHGITTRMPGGQFPAGLDVTLDLNGFTIAGTNTCTASGTWGGCDQVADPEEGRGIELGSPGGGLFTISNGTVRGMPGFGIYCNVYCTIERVQVTQNGGGGIFTFGQVRDSNAVLNGGAGIFNQSQAGVMEACTAISNEFTGIGGSGTFLNNAASSNFVTQGAFSSATVIGNRFLGNSFVDDTGVSCFNCVVRDNQIASATTGLDFQNSPSLYGGNFIDATTPLAQSGSAVQDGVNLCNGSACP